MDQDAEQRLKLELMQMDLNLKTKQAFWETPRNIAILLGTAIALTGALSGWLGFKLGQTPPAPIIIQLQQPPSK